MFMRLLWKELRENLWKIGFCGTVSAVFTIMLFRIRLFPDSASCFLISFVQMLAVPIIFALDIFSGEMSNRTIHLLFKFPIPRWKIFFSKYLVSISGIVIVFLVTGILMEALSRGRETPVGFLIKMNIGFGVVVLLLFTWFCAFAAQSRSEAGSLVAIIGVMVGWSIIMLWSTVCDVTWAKHFVPYNFMMLYMPANPYNINHIMLLFFSICGAVVALAIACRRFVKVRRCL